MTRVRNPNQAKEFLLKKRTVLILAVVLLTTALVASCVPAAAPTTPPSAATAAPSAQPLSTPAASAQAQGTPAAAQATLVLPGTAAQTAAPTIAPDKRTPAPAPAADGSRPIAQIPPAQRADRFSGPAPMTIVTGTKYLATIVTSKGNIVAELYPDTPLSLIHISEPTRLGMISYAVFCLKKKKK